MNGILMTGRCAARCRRSLLLVAVLSSSNLLGADISSVVSIPSTNPPLVTIQTFLDSAPSWGERIKVRLRGTVTHSISDKTFFIQEGEAGVYVFHKPVRKFGVGEEVELIGSPSLGGVAPTLHHCVVEAIGRGTPPDPVELSVEHPFEHNMKLVRVRGYLAPDRLLQGRTLLVRLEGGQQVLSAELEGLPDLEALPELRPGSLLELTGVLSLRRGPDKKPADLRLFIRTPKDIVVVAGPPFWTMARVRQVLGLTGLGLALALGWVWTLRRQVKSQTAIISKRFEALKASEDRFAKIFRASPDPIVLVRAKDEQVLDVNPAFESLLGYSRAEAVGRRTSELDLWVNPVVRDQATRLVKEQGIVSNFECQLRARSGAVLTCLGSTEKVEIDGEPCLLSHVRDVTERERLATRSQQTQRMESLGTLASGIAHDFNNIVGGILGSAELAQHQLDANTPAQRDLKTIRAACLRARDLVRQILTFSRRQPEERRVVSLRHTVEEAIRLLRATVPATIHIEHAVDPNCPPVLADLGRLHQVIMNLGTNAWHAMETRPGRLTITLRGLDVNGTTEDGCPDLEPGRYAWLSVSDEGCGMDQATRERIFEPFYTTKGPGKGTGLGLAVVQRVVSDHDGAISVQSQPGQGSSFNLYFPAVQEHATAAASVQPELGLPRGQGEHVLYIDDEEPLVLLATRSLQQLGYRVTGFTNPSLGLAAFEANPDHFQALMTDLNMPGISGLDVIQRVRQLRPDLRIVLASGFLSDEAREKAAAHGVQGFLYKPHSLQDLARALHHVFHGRSELGYPHSSAQTP